MAKLTDNFHKYATQYRNKPEPQWPPKPDPRSWVGPITGRHYTGIIMDDLEDHPEPYPCGDPKCGICLVYRRQNAAREAKKPTPSYEEMAREAQKSKKEVNMSEATRDFEYQNLYEVTTTYGGDRNDVIVKRTDVVAESENRALMQSKDDIEDDWDMDYVDQNVESICAVRVKLKPRETKEVAK